MKITNIVLAAMMIVAAPTFANQAVSKATEAAVTAAVKNLTTTQAQTAARSLGLNSNASAAQVTAAVLKAIEAGKIKESSIVSKQNGQSVVSSNQLMAAVNSSSQSKMPDSRNKQADGGVTIGSTDRETRRGGSLIGSVDQEPVRGEDSDRLDVMVRSCGADGRPLAITGACDKLNDEASKSTWATLSSKIVATAAAKGIQTAGQIKADTTAWTKNVLATTMEHFKTSCADAVTRIKGLSAKGGCEVINEAYLNQAALACSAR